MNAIQIKEQLKTIKDAVPAGMWEEALSLLAAEGGAKPKRVLTEEHKAKLKAGKAAAKATRDAAKATATATATAPATAPAPESEKPKRVLSDEHKAKLKAGKAAAKATRDAAKATATAPATAPESEKPKRVLSDEHKAKLKAGKAAKAEREVKKAEPESDGEIVIAGERYFRLADGRCYHPGDEGVAGAWAGIFVDGVLDTTVAEM